MRYEIKALSIGGVIDQALSVVKNHFGILMALACIFLVPVQLPSNLIQAMFESSLAPGGDFREQIEQQQQAQLEMFTKYGPILLICGLASLVLTPLANAAIVHAVATAYLGRVVTVKECLGAAFRKFFPLLWTWILMGVIFMVGLMLCVVPGILFMLWYSLATQVAVIENVNGVAALRRSKAIIQGHIGQYFALMLVMVLMMVMVAVGAAFVPQPHAKAIAITVIQVLWTIVLSAAAVVFYFSCRCANENFDLQLLAQEVSDSAAPATSDVGDGL